MPALLAALIAPKAISSFCAKIALMFGFACSIFSATVRPLLLSKSAFCLATTFSFLSAMLWKPCPRSRVAEAPGIPSSSATSAPSPSFCTRKSAAISPPLILLEAIWATTSPESEERSMVITGILASLAATTELPIAAESTGLTIRTLTPCSIRSETSLACLAGSFCASTILTSTPCLAASALTLSAILTKNGLFCVETEKPMVIFLSEDAAS